MQEVVTKTLGWCKEVRLEEVRSRWTETSKKPGYWGAVAERHSSQNHKGFVEWGYRGALKSGVNEKKKNALRYATGKVHAQIPGLSTEWHPPRAEISGDK